MRSLALLAAFAALSPSPADACSCAERTLAQATDDAEAVFVATVTKAIPKKTCQPQRPNVCHTTYAYDVTVEGVWKGSLATKLRIELDGGMCTLSSLHGAKRWLIFAGKDLHLSLCGGTRHATPETVAAMIKLRGAPKTP
jgi:hypothetical protein